MKYLFFDLEYATSRGGVDKICEFGYVVTDETFKVLDKSNYIINPNIDKTEWDYRVLKKLLTRERWEYEDSPTFDKYYEDICELIKDADYIVGHSLNGDAKALNDDCLRYNLPSIDFEFYDVKEIYKAYVNTRKDTSVSNIKKNLGITGDERAHDAEADAYNTMLEFKEMLSNLEMSFEELLPLVKNVKDKNENYIVDSLKTRKEHSEKRIVNGETIKGNYLRNNYKVFIRFLDNVEPTIECEQTLKDLKFSITINYENTHFKELMNIIQILCNLGATYVLKASKSDYFVKYDTYNEDGSIRCCSKSKYVNEANEKGANIKIIDFNNFLKMIGITNEELEALPIPSLNCLSKKDVIIRSKQEKVKTEI